MSEPQRQFKGVWIPAEIWESEELSWMEKCLLAEINSLSPNDGSGCFASNAYLARKFRSTEASIANMLSHLRKMGLLETQSFNGRERRMAVKADLTCGLRQGSLTGEGSINPGVKAHIVERTVEKKGENDLFSGETNGRKRFTPPTTDQLEEYFLELGFNGTADQQARKFFDYYEARGWNLGKTKMVDWRAACRTWRSNQEKFHVEQSKLKKDHLGAWAYKEGDDGAS